MPESIPENIRTTFELIDKISKPLRDMAAQSTKTADTLEAAKRQVGHDAGMASSLLTELGNTLSHVARMGVSQFMPLGSTFDIVFGHGYELAKAMEGTVISMASAMKAGGAVGSFSEGMEEARADMEIINKLAAQLPGEAQEYIEAFKTNLPSLLESKLGTRGAATFVSRYVAATTSLGVDSRQSSMDLQRMLHGQAASDNITWMRIKSYLGPDAGKWKTMSVQKRREVLEKNVTDPTTGKFAEAIAAYGNTMESAEGTLKSFAETIQRSFSTPIFNVVKGATVGLANYLSSIQDQTAAGATALGEAMVTAGAKILGPLSKIDLYDFVDTLFRSTGPLADIFNKVVDVSSILIDDFTPLGQIAVDVGGMLWDIAVNTGKMVVDTFGDLFVVTGSLVKDAFEPLVPLVKELGGLVRDYVVPGLSGMAEKMGVNMDNFHAAGNYLKNANEEADAAGEDWWGKVDVMFLAYENSLAQATGNQELQAAVADHVTAEMVTNHAGLTNAMTSSTNSLESFQVALGATSGLLNHWNELTGGLGSVIKHGLTSLGRTLRPALKPPPSITNNDFKGSHINVKMDFDKAFDPDRTVVAFTKKLAQVGEQRIQSGMSLPFGVR